MNRSLLKAEGGWLIIAQVRTRAPAMDGKLLNRWVIRSTCVIGAPVIRMAASLRRFRNGPESYSANLPN